MTRFVLVALLSYLSAAELRAEPVAPPYLYDGKLKDGVAALTKRLADKSDDDETRVGLGVLQLLRSFETLGTGLHMFGLRKSLLGDFIPTNTKPKTVTDDDARRLVQTFLDDILAAEKTLAAVSDDKVKLRLRPGKIRVDVFGVGKPVSAAVIFGRLNQPDQQRIAENVVVGFDRGDVSWLRGYIHFLAAWIEVGLATDTTDLFETCGHLVFAEPKTPHAWLREVPGLNDPAAFAIPGLGIVAGPLANFDLPNLIRSLAAAPLKEPKRLESARLHLKAMAAQSREMWKHVLAETDDDNEWIPNPKQKSVTGVAVKQEMIDEWLKVLAEGEAVLDGTKLLPFWRGKPGERGINLKKFLAAPPKRLDLVRLVQGTDFTPYLEKGAVTPLADDATIKRIDLIFGGRFFAYAAWFN